MALDKFEPPIGDEYVPILREAYAEWMRRKEVNATAPEDGVRVIPDSPRPALLKLLVRLSEVTCLPRCDASQVRSAIRDKGFDTALFDERVRPWIDSIISSLAASGLDETMFKPLANYAFQRTLSDGSREFARLCLAIHAYWPGFECEFYNHRDTGGRVLCAQLTPPINSVQKLESSSKLLFDSPVTLHRCTFAAS